MTREHHLGQIHIAAVALVRAYAESRGFTMWDWTDEDGVTMASVENAKGIEQELQAVMHIRIYKSGANAAANVMVR